MEQLQVRPRRYEPSTDLALDPHLRPEPGGYIELPPDSGEGDDWSRWLGYLAVLSQHKIGLAGAAAAGALLGLVFSVFQTPLYVASTTLEFQPQSAHQQPFEGISFLETSDPYLLQTQAQLLSSDLLKSRVQTKLREVRAARTSREPAVSQPTSTGLLGAMRDAIGVGHSGSDWETALGYARARLKIAPVKDSRVVTISAESTSPDVAADYVNTTASEFINQTLEDRWSLYQSTSAWLTRAQQDLKAQLEDSERQLLTYASESGLVVTNKDDSIAEQKLVQLQAEASRAQADRIAKESAYRTAMNQSPESLASVLDPGATNQYDTKLADLRRELADVSTTLTPEHPRVKRLEAQIAAMESSKQTETGNVLGRLRRDYEAAQYRERQLVADLNAQSAALSSEDKKLIRYKMLQREADTYRTLYDTTLQRGKEASVASALRPVSARVVDAARAPRIPFKPNLPMNLGLGLAGGLAIGVALILFRERTDGSIRVPGSIPGFLNIRELGVIPAAAAEPDPLRVVGGRKPARALRGRVVPAAAARDPGSEPVELATWNRKSSIVAESFRATLTSLLTSAGSTSNRQIVLVTSPSPQEGKSTVITNLAIALAEIDQRVLLIDADLRRPRLHTVLNQANTWGLSDLLRETTPVEEYASEGLFRKTQIPRLSFLPSGPGSVNVSRLLYSARMVELLERYRREFDAVVIDTPPVLRVADARILSRLADAVVLVFRAGITTRESASLAASVLAADGAPLLGTILNDWDPRTMGHGYYAGQYEGYRDASSL